MVICEDLWQDGGPITALGDAGVDLVVYGMLLVVVIAFAPRGLIGLLRNRGAR